MNLSTLALQILYLLNFVVRSQEPWLTNSEINADPLPYRAAGIISGYNNKTGEVWLIGGTDSNGPTPNITVFNVSSQTMSRNPNYLIASYSLYANEGQKWVQDNSLNIWIIDPWPLNSIDSNNFIKFNMESETFHTGLGTTFQHHLCSRGCISYYKNPYNSKEYLLITGGLDQYDGTGSSDPCLSVASQNLYVYDIDNDSFLRYGASGNSEGVMTETRQKHTCAVHTDVNYLYAIGGYSRKTIEKLYINIDLSQHGAMGMWNSSGDVVGYTLSQRQYDARSVVYGQYIYVYGGNIAGAGNLVDKIDVMTDMVTKETMDLPYEVRNTAPVLINGIVYLFGGQLYSSTVYNTWMYQSIAPTSKPTSHPTTIPTLTPSQPPSNNPTAAPSAAPSNSPSVPPTVAPTGSPTEDVLVPKTGTCPDGYQPFTADPNNFCEPCLEYESGTLGKCDRCGDGKQPNNDRTSCILCSEQLIGIDGYCDFDCSQRNKIANELHTECIEEAEAEAWYATSEFDAIISIIGTLTGCSCIGAFFWAFCKKKACFAKSAETKEKTEGMVEGNNHKQVVSTSQLTETQALR